MPSQSCLGSIALCVFASPLDAQTWSSEQQAVLAVVEQSYVDALGKDATWVDRFIRLRAEHRFGDEPELTR